MLALNAGKGVAVRFGANYTGESIQGNDLANAEPRTQPYVISDLSVALKSGDLTAKIGVENLQDVVAPAVFWSNHSNVSVYYPNRGRTLFLAVSYGI